MAFDLTAQMNLAAPSTRQVDKALGSINKSLDKGTKKAQVFSDVVSLKATNFAAYTVASAAVLKLTSSISNAVTQAIRLEKELVKVSQIVGISVNSARKLSKEVLEISTNYGISATKVAETIKTLTQSGLSFDKARKAAELLAKTTLLSTFDSLSSTTEGLIAIMAQFNLTVKETESAIGAINVLSKRYAVESSDLIDAVKRTGGVFAATGGKIEDLLGLITTVRSTTRETAETISTGLKTIFTRLQRPRTIQYLKELNIELADSQGNLLDGKKALDAISAGLERLGIRAGSVKFAEVAQEIAGVRQQSRLIPLLTQQAKVAETNAVANARLAETDEDVAKAKQTLAFRIDQVKARFEALVAEISQSNSFKLLTNTLLNLADSFLSVASALKPLIPVLAAFAAIKITSTVGKTLRNFKGGSGGGGVLGFNRGGVVPGSGNGDTVPAMLESGEFVVRKSAVQAFGADKLAGINKYAQGGKIKNFNIGAKYTVPPNYTYDKKGGDPFNKNSSSSNPRNSFNDVDTFSFEEKPIDVKVTQNDFINDATLREQYEKGGIERGKAFEKIVAKRHGVTLAQKENHDKATSSRLDGVKGKIPVEIKSTAESQSGLISSKIIGGALEPKSYNTDSILSDKLDQSKLNKGQDNIDFDKIILYQDTTDGLGKKADKPLKKALGGSIRGVGTDTQPALLTPGEFVINKKSAQDFGYGNLEKINKYSRGGIVEGKATVSENISEDVNRTLDGLVGTFGDAENAFDVITDNMGAVGEEIKRTISFSEITKDQKFSARTSDGETTQIKAPRGVFSRKRQDIAVNPAKASTSTVLHEVGHAGDSILGKQAGGEGLASEQTGTFQNQLVEAAKAKLKIELEAQVAAGKITEKDLGYRLQNAEIFADMFAKSDPVIQKILVSTTDAAAGMEALNNAINDNDIDRLYADIEGEVERVATEAKSQNKPTEKSIKAENKIGGQDALTESVKDGGKVGLLDRVNAATPDSGKTEAKVLSDIRDVLASELPESVNVLDQINAEIPNSEDDQVKVLNDIRNILSSGKTENVNILDKVNQETPSSGKSDIEIDSGVREILGANDVKRDRNILDEVNRGPLPLPSNTKPEPTIFLPIPKEEHTASEKVTPKFEKTASSMESLFESTAVLSLGFSVFTKSLLGADSELGNFVDKLSGELIKNQIIATSAGEAGSKVGTGLLSGIQKLTTKDDGTEEGKKQTKANRVESIGKAADALATVALQATILYKSFKDASLAIEIETQARLKKVAIEKGDVVGAEKAAAAGSDAAAQKTSGDLAAGVLGGIGGAVGSAVGGGLALLFPVLAPIAPLLISIGGKIGTALGVFASTFKGVQSVVVWLADKLIEGVNYITSWFGGDPFPTLTETFEKNKRLAVERARSEALFNKSVKIFDDSQKNLSSKIDQSSALNGEGSQKTQNLIVSQLESTSLSSADFSSQLQKEKRKPVEEQDEAAINNLKEQLNNAADATGDGVKRLAASLREGGSDLSQALNQVGAKLDSEGGVVGISDNSALAAFRDSLIAAGDAPDIARERTLAFAAELVTATAKIKASQEAFDELANFNLGDITRGLEVSGIKSQTRSNKSNTPQTEKQARRDTSEIFKAANGMNIFSGTVSNAGQFIAELSASTKEQAIASQAVTESGAFATGEELKSLTAAKIAREGEIKVGKELIQAKKGELEASKRATAQLYTITDLELFGTTEEKRRNEEGLALTSQFSQSKDKASFLESQSNDDRKLIEETLNRYSDTVIDETGGKTGDDIKAEARQSRLGGETDINTIRNESSSKQEALANEIESYQLAIQASEQAIVDQDFQNRMIANEAFKSAVELFAGKVDENINGKPAIPIAVGNANDPSTKKIREDIAGQDKAIAEADRILKKATEKSIVTARSGPRGRNVTRQTVKKSDDELTSEDRQQIAFAEGIKKRATERKNALQSGLEKGSKNTPDQIVDQANARQNALKYANTNSFGNNQIDSSDKQLPPVKVTHDHKFGPIELTNIPQQGAGDAMVELGSRISEAGHKQKQAEEMGSPNPESSFDELFKY